MPGSVLMRTALVTQWDCSGASWLTGDLYFRAQGEGQDPEALGLDLG